MKTNFYRKEFTLTKFTPIGPQPPIDPAYLRFLEGLKRMQSGDKGDRWNYKKENWYNYTRKAWIIEDLGVKGTPTSSVFEKKLDSHLKPYWVINENNIPDLYKQLQKDGAIYSKQFPKANLIWSPWEDGYWRSAILRSSSIRPPYHPNETSPGDSYGFLDEQDYPDV